ncbi:MAG: SMODS domain-containing nucleotidyltransferase, partial [Pseudolabrys sp.]
MSFALPPKKYPFGSLAGLAPPPPPSTGLGSLLSGAPTQSGLAATTLLGGALAPTPSMHKWFFVTGRFTRLLGELTITASQREDGQTKQVSVRSCLNRHYWCVGSETSNSMLIGSWGKDTRLRPPRDVDILFLLPASVYVRFQVREGNRQSQLLQEVKDVLAQTYTQTTMRGDGQVVLIPFNSTPVEVAPGFRCRDGSIIVCDTNGGGRYITSTAEAEASDLSASDALWNGNTRALARMAKRWQREHNVPLKSFQIERLAVHFLQGWSYSHQNVFYYDWMIRDFFAYLIRYANGTLTMPGTGEVVPLGDAWLNRAEQAYSHAVEACNHERDNHEASAGQEWQAIFGTA